MVLLTLSHMRPGVLTMEVKDKEQRLFSSMDKAERWLINNNFLLGQRPFFNYKDDSKEWCHWGETSWDFIDVDFQEFETDLMDDSKFKNTLASKAPWHEGE